VIVLDTSALMALLLDEPEAEAVAACLASDEDLTISAGTLAEARIVAARRGLAEEMSDILEGLAVDVVPLDASGALEVAAAYSAWGKGQHPAGLNLGDCFAYATAKKTGSGLLYVGDDFARTDLPSAL